MKPELVDAAFRRKSNHRRLTASAAFDEPVFIDNFKPLEKDDLLDFFQDISCGDSTQPLMTPLVGAGESINNFDAGNIYFLESEASEIFNLNYSTVPSSSSPTYSLSPGSSSSSSSYSLSPPSSSYSNSLSPSSYSDYSDINDMSTMAADGTYTININLTDIENQIFNLPDSVYQTQTEPELHHLENSFTAMNTVDKDVINNHDEAEDNGDEDSDDSDDVNNSFNIEALVDECFMNQTIAGSAAPAAPAASDKQLITQS